MITPQIYVAITIVVLAVVAILVFYGRRGKTANKITPLASIAFGFVIAGIVFGDDRLIGYSLMGVGIVLAILDMFNQSRQSPQS